MASQLKLFYSFSFFHSMRDFGFLIDFKTKLIFHIHTDLSLIRLSGDRRRSRITERESYN